MDGQPLGNQAGGVVLVYAAGWLDWLAVPIPAGAADRGGAARPRCPSRPAGRPAPGGSVARSAASAAGGTSDQLLPVVSTVEVHCGRSRGGRVRAGPAPPASAESGWAVAAPGPRRPGPSRPPSVPPGRSSRSRRPTGPPPGRADPHPGRRSGRRPERGRPREALRWLPRPAVRRWPAARCPRRPRSRVGRWWPGPGRYPGAAGPPRGGSGSSRRPVARRRSAPGAGWPPG